jgi:hypothetical protein
MPKWLASVALASAVAAPALAQPERSFPQPGDTWTYRLTEHPRRNPPVQSNYIVKVKEATPGMNVLDEVSRDGAAPVEGTHSRGRHMVEQVVSVFSPYLVAFEDLKPGDRISRVTEHDDDCFGWLDCWTAGRVEGHETVELAAGSFDTIKVTLEQNIRKRTPGARLSTRTLTIWYSPQAKRTVKVTSRVSRTLTTTFHANFDLELLSYHLTAPQPLDRTQVLAPREAAGSEPRHARVIGNSADVMAPPATATRDFPRVGDTWTYRLTDRRGGKPPVQSSYVVKVKATRGTKVLDEVSRDGAAPVEWTHSPGRYMVEQVVSVFSPYLVVFEDLKPGDRIWRVSEPDGCSVKCSTVGRVEGRETLRVPAGKFDTIKVRLDQSRQVEGLPREPRRILTIWYSPQVKRAVKFTTRSFGREFEVFDIELSSYQLQ